MKAAAIYFTATFLFVFIFSGCGNNDNQKEELPQEEGIPYSPLQTYIHANIGETLWTDTLLGTCYVKIPQYDNPSWFDVVLSSDDLNSPQTKVIKNYFYLHVNMPQAKSSFEFNAPVVFYGGFNIIYYENKLTTSESAEFSLYMTSSSGQIVVTENDGEYLSGYFEGVLTNGVNTEDKRISTVRFNKVPVSLAK